ncbi:class I SAM-dependent methyltransferase [Myxacorys almedinensis]|uniref:Methyltransferase domain-containing protein n=1 Tax=Myxacorys almedinensis A TaxID=2690445 RepID=A0A8J7Z359_9CYAN|nr:class I SAM-dependent methyltransferase [Myxacorys almedinensis]NDJ19132.1 methyltransferase domain-containing protein [Myxacorys almedinensis A]
MKSETAFVKALPEANLLKAEMSRYIEINTYDEYEEDHAYYKEMMAKMLDSIASHRQKQNEESRRCRILELGAGTGIFTKRLATLPNVEIVAIEIDQVCLQRLEKRFHQCDFVTVVHADSCSFVQPNAFDYICSSFSDHHIERSQKANYLEQVKQNLKPGGLFVVGDEFLRTYDPRDRGAWQRALKDYHHHIIAIAHQHGHAELAALESQALWSGLHELGDFKVSNQAYETLLARADLKFSVDKIGPAPSLDIGGVYVYQIHQADPSGLEGALT